MLQSALTLFRSREPYCFRWTELQNSLSLRSLIGPISLPQYKQPTTVIPSSPTGTIGIIPPQFNKYRVSFPLNYHRVGYE